VALDLTYRPGATRRAPSHPLWQCYQWELEKLTAQFRTRAAALVCLLAPAAFAIGLQLSSTVPADTLFGRWVGDSGFAIPLVVLGFAGSWGFPLIACLVAGDIFSAEDHYQTWTSILTRSVSRRSIFGGKVLAALTYTLAVVLLLSLSSLASGVLVVGHQPLIGLTGNEVPASRALWLVLASWGAALPAVLVSATLGIAISVVSRNSLAGIIGPTVVGLLLQLLLLVGGIGAVRTYLPNAAFVSWHGLWADPSFTQPMLLGIVAAAVYATAFLWLAWGVFRGRDVGAA
jgi:ABC-2 type transport system permease protein